MKLTHSKRVRRSRASAGGFTLIEVLLAVSIIVSLMVIIWGSISVSFKSREYMSASFDQYQRLRLSMDRMARELSMAYISAHANRKENLPNFDPEDINTGEGTQEDIAAGVEDALADRADLEAARDFYIESAFVGKRNEVHFTSLAHVRTRPGERASDQAEISYFVRTSRRRNNDGRLTRELVRREDSTPDDDIEDGGVIYTLVDDVEEVEFEYWRPGREGDEEGGGRWVDSWDSRNSEFRGTLPSRVKITLEVPIPKNADEKTRVFSTQTQIMMTEILDF